MIPLPIKSYSTFLLKRLSIFSIIIFSISAFVFILLFKSYYNNIYTLLLIFNICVTYILLLVFYKTFIESPEKFNKIFLFFLPIKLLIYLIFFGVYIFLNKSGAIPFTIIFLSLYLVFSVFEVKEILRFSKN